MELYRLKELIYLAIAYMEIGCNELDALIKAENELKNIEGSRNEKTKKIN